MSEAAYIATHKDLEVVYKGEPKTRIPPYDHANMLVPKNMVTKTKLPDGAEYQYRVPASTKVFDYLSDKITCFRPKHKDHVKMKNRVARMWPNFL